MCGGGAACLLAVYVCTQHENLLSSTCVLALQSTRLGIVAQLSAASSNAEWREALHFNSLDDLAEFLCRCLPQELSVQDVKERLAAEVNKVSGVRRAAACLRDVPLQA